jgi:hypothetical protein
MANNYTDLKFLTKVYPLGYLKWDDNKIMELVSDIKGGTTKLPTLAKKHGVKESSVKNIISELKRAAREGMSLEVYLKKGRPLRTGKKVLA